MFRKWDGEKLRDWWSISARGQSFLLRYGPGARKFGLEMGDFKMSLYWAMDVGMYMKVVDCFREEMIGVL